MDELLLIPKAGRLCFFISPASVEKEHIHAAIVGFFAFLREKTARKFTVCAVICHALAALSVARTGIGAGA